MNDGGIILESRIPFSSGRISSEQNRPAHEVIRRSLVVVGLDIRDGLGAAAETTPCRRWLGNFEPFTTAILSEGPEGLRDLLPADLPARDDQREGLAPLGHHAS
jgi:hypothetical protein